MQVFKIYSIIQSSRRGRTTGRHWANNQVAWVYFQLCQKPCKLGQCCLTAWGGGEGAAAATSLLFCDSATRYPRGFPPKAKELGIFFLNQQTGPLIPIAMLQELPALSGYSEEQGTLGEEVLHTSSAA